MELYKTFEKVGFIKGIQHSEQLFNESKSQVEIELDEHFKKLTEMDEHTMNIYKMGCKYAIELLQFSFSRQITAELIKQTISWDTEKQGPEK